MTAKPCNSRILVQLGDPNEQSAILRPDGSRMLEPIGIVLAADPAVTQCAVGDKVLFANTENVILCAPQVAERAYFLPETDVLAILT